MDLPDFFKTFPYAAFVALDFETTGLDSERGRVTEIGAVKFTKYGLGESFSMLVDPGIPIEPGASRVSGITDEMVRGKMPADDAIPELMAFVGGAGIVAHNAKFDMGFLKAAVKRTGMKRLRNPVFDTIEFARMAKPGLRSYSLQRLLPAFSIDPGTAHRALDDARATAVLFLKCLALMAPGETVAVEDSFLLERV